MAKNVTAPLNWKSSPDSPSTQLAYVTQPEIDMLVKANLHGSMKGKPNVGPKGIMSLDGDGVSGEDWSAWETQQDWGSPGGVSDVGPSGYTGGSGDTGGGDIIEAVQDEEKKKAKQSILAAIGFAGQEPDPTVDPDDPKYNQPGMHKLRSQFDRLADKYYGGGEKGRRAFAKTSQGQTLLRYLAGVPFTKGGGLGLRDPQYGGGITTLDPTAEALRQAVLRAQTESGGTVNLKKSLLGPSNAVYGPARGNLTPSQYQNFMQQVHQANPAAFEKAFPGASGKLPGKLFNLLASPGMTIGTGIMESLGLTKEKELDPMYTGEAFDPSLFYDLAQIEDQGQGQDLAQNIATSGLPGEEDEEDVSGYDWDLYNQYLQDLGGTPTINVAQGGEVKGYRGGGLSELVSDNDMSYNNAIGDFMQRRKYNI